MAETQHPEGNVIASAQAADGSEIMHLLERGVPLTLLMDLLSPLGPRSTEILDAERPIVA